MEVEEEEDDAPLARMDDDQHAVGPEDLQMDAPGIVLLGLSMRLLC